MSENLKSCIGKGIERIFLEWFYFNNQPESIGRLYIQVDSYFDITCCEENVFIREQKETPTTQIFDEFTYKPIEQNIEWLHQCEIISIKYLVDSLNIKRGILFVFEQNHNFMFYNRGYEFDDEDNFEIDVNMNSLLYDVIDI
jgi:hypothetical protein